MSESSTVGRRALLFLVAAAFCLAPSCAGSGARGPDPSLRVGGCVTSSHDYGLPVLEDSLAAAAVDEMLAPLGRPGGGDARERLGVNAPLFVEIGALEAGEDRRWVRIAGELTTRLAETGLVIARRSALRHTVGPCFPPFHVDFQACGDSARVMAFLDSLPSAAWEGFQRVSRRGEREIFVTAGMSMQSMDWVVDLRSAPAR